ncbi:hypothetical protein F5Y09DRAFT_319330 [Xylaria sp. FL1042]|nr:hypothetical protein F5Y09DRAFT_319330 [Xylaria sp. FL1042]
MKTTIAFLPLLPFALATVDPENMSLKDANCDEISLDDQYTLQATCPNPYGYNPPEWRVELSLNQCFANYLGTLNYVPHGNFGQSCSDCHLDNYILTCQCGIGEGKGTKEATYNLNDSGTIKLMAETWNFTMECHGLYDFTNQKRTDAKEARLFVA